MNRMIGIVMLACGLAVVVPGCKQSEAENPARKGTDAAIEAEHVHADGSTHAADEQAESDDHAHDEVSLAAVTVGDMKVELAQGHGKVVAGMEGHLVVKLPYNDSGATVVRAWIGTADRLRSVVGKGEYAPSHNDFDIHAMAPTPLPENVMWWFEIEKPDGTKLVGSAKPLLD